METLIKSIISAETKALNSEAGQKLLQRLHDEAIQKKPDMTAEEWKATKKHLLVSVFFEILKENPVIESKLRRYFEEKI